LQALKKKLNKLSTEAHRQRPMPNHPCHKSRKLVVQEYGKAILKAKKQHWIDLLEEASDRDLWTTNHYLKNPIGDRGKARIPTLKIKNGDSTLKEVASNAEKAEVFHRIFFPLRLEISSVPENFQYPATLPAPPVISLDQNFSPYIRPVVQIEFQTWYCRKPWNTLRNSCSLSFRLSSSWASMWTTGGSLLW
jgi:hypothetical protein